MKLISKELQQGRHLAAFKKPFLTVISTSPSGARAERAEVPSALRALDHQHPVGKVSRPSRLGMPLVWLLRRVLNGR